MSPYYLVNQVQTSQPGTEKDSKPSLIKLYTIQGLTQALELDYLDSNSFSIKMLALFLSLSVQSYKKNSAYLTELL